MEEVTGRVFDIQRFTVHDGPGIRTDVFLKGCPLTCLWCHSPESQATQAQLAWFEIRCIGVAKCGRCLDACSKQAISLGKLTHTVLDHTQLQLIQIDRNLCDDCGQCTEACPSKALSMAGTDMTIREVMDIIVKDTKYYLKSGGGVTISGGEPMVQHQFTTALLRECKAQGLHTCLDTTGFAKWELYEKVLPFVDLFLYDLKHMDSKQSQILTGVPNELIVANARKIASAGGSLQIRIPIIPSLNDSDENLRATSAFCAELGSAVQMVQILPYHRLGAVKYERFQKDYEIPEIEAPSDEQMERAKTLVESYGLQVKIH